MATGQRSEADIKQTPWTGPPADWCGAPLGGRSDSDVGAHSAPADRWSAPSGGRSDSDVGADISAGALATWG